MKTFIASLFSFFAIIVTALPFNQAVAGGSTLFKFNELIAVDGFFVGSDALRGIPGGGVAWVIDRGEARLKADGELRVKVRGLVLASTGVNPSETFFATLSCLDRDTGAVENRDTDTVPAGADGNANIRDDLDLPKTCVAPIVFVRGASGNWFAVTGFVAQADEEDPDD